MSKADLLEAWGEHLRNGRRRSPHTVRAYLATADRLLTEEQIGDWRRAAALDAAADGALDVCDSPHAVTSRPTIVRPANALANPDDRPRRSRDVPDLVSNSASSCSDP